MKKIVITGGHHNSALVVAKDLQKNNITVEWIGHRHAANNDRNDSAEYLEVNSSNIRFHVLKAGKLDTNLKNLYAIPRGFYQARQYLKHISPDAILSFGGYLGLSVSLPAFLMGIPIYLHEQTLVAGKANVITGKFARRIYLSWPQSAKYFRNEKTKLVGLPLRNSILHPKPHKLFANDLPTILVLCGKQGSHKINQYIFSILDKLLLKYNIIHQTGMSSATGDYETAMARKDALPTKLAPSYHPVSYIGEVEIGQYLSSVDLVIGRSGAHTAYELGVLGKKALLIPYMHTTGREQYLQAKLLAESGNALILLESNLTSNNLLSSIEKLRQLSPATKLDLPTNASEQLIIDLLKDLENI